MIPILFGMYVFLVLIAWGIWRIGDKLDKKCQGPFDWDRFRAETARDVLAGMMGHERIRYDDSLHERQVKTAIEYADELIKQLKEE